MTLGRPGARRPAAGGSGDGGFGPVLSLVSGRAVAFVATFFIPIVLARVFDQAEFGTYKQVFLIYSTLYFAAQLGMAESLFYFLPLAPRQGGRYVANSVLFLAIAGVAGLAILWAGGPRIAGLLNNGALAPLMPLVALYLSLTMAASVLEIVLVARKRFGWASWAYGASDVLRAACFIVPAVAFQSLAALVVGAVAFATVRAIAAVGYLRREFGPALRPDRALLRRQLAYATPFGLAVLVEIVQANLHQYAVAYTFDAATFAVYAVGCLQPPLLDFVATPAGNVMMVRMREAMTAGQTRVALAVWHDTTRKLALLLVPLAALQIVAAREIIVGLFTTTYLASVPIFMVWSAAVGLAAVLTDGVLRVHADTRALLLLNALRLLLIASLIVPFLALFQLPGAALVTVLAAALTKGLALARLKRLMQVGAADLLPWRALGLILAAAAGAGVPALVLSAEWGGGPLPRLAGITAVYGAAYVALLWGLGGLTTGERQTIARRLPWVSLAAARAAASKTR